MEVERCTARWSITASPHPQLSLRLLGLVAQRDCVPRSMLGELDADLFRLVIVVDDFPPRAAELLAEKMRAMVGVTLVDLAIQRPRP
jgi:acetolactate synthase regulatory subunit